MPSYLITYDLVKKRDYEKLFEAIKKVSGYWCHVTESSWIVTSDNMDSSEIRDLISKSVDDDDKLFVAKFTGQGAWKNMSSEQSDWIKKYL